MIAEFVNGCLPGIVGIRVFQKLAKVTSVRVIADAMTDSSAAFVRITLS
jgi:hypothetical protein